MAHHHLCSKQGDHIHIYIHVYVENISGNSHKLVTAVAPGEWKLIGRGWRWKWNENLYPFVLWYFELCTLEPIQKIKKKGIQSKNNSPTPESNLKRL